MGRNGIGNQPPAAAQAAPSPPIHCRMNLAGRLSRNYVSVNLRGDNPADVILKLPTMTIKGFGKTAETYSARVYERDDSPGWPSDSELPTLRQAVSARLHSQLAVGKGSAGEGLDLTLRAVDQMIRNRNHGVPARFEDQASIPAQPKQAPMAVTLFHD
jgi:hypothetical protein